MAEVRRRRREYWAGLGAVAIAVLVSALGLWPVPKVVTDEPVLETVLIDPVLIGVVRLALVVVALYGIASVSALIVGGRWAKGVGTSGIVADDARTHLPADLLALLRQVADLELENARLLAERDELLSLVDDQTRPA